MGSERLGTPLPGLSAVFPPQSLADVQPLPKTPVEEDQVPQPDTHPDHLSPEDDYDDEDEGEDESDEDGVDEEVKVFIRVCKLK